jgi:DNA mismatch repair protein MutL
VALDESFHRAAPRLAGEALGVYILVEQGDQLILIDKHAAHERILFDRMRLADEPLMSQSLLAPVVYSPGGEGTELLLNNRELLERLGFELESYGADAVVLRAVPRTWTPTSAPRSGRACGQCCGGAKPDAGDIRKSWPTP